MFGGHRIESRAGADSGATGEPAAGPDRYLCCLTLPRSGDRRLGHLPTVAAQFVSSLSHEFKTPLTAIRMFAEMLRMRPDSETELCESERLSRLVDNGLNFPKIEQGRRL